MSFGGSFDAAVSALRAQTQALSTIAQNLANSSTVGYKAIDTTFSSLVTGESDGSAATAGGVIASGRQNVAAAGLISASSRSTDMALSGNGMFVVRDGLNGQIDYTRDGEFGTDDQGYLVNGNEHLLGWPTDKNGVITAGSTGSTDSLQAINVNRYASTAAATTTVSLQANLPADGTSGGTFNSTLDVYDSLGVAQTVPLTWTKSASVDNEWTLTIGNPVSSASGAATGTIGGNTTYTVDFNTNGTLASIKDASGTSVSTATITVASWNDGAAAGSMTLNLGTVGGIDGLTQYASSESSPSVDVKSTQQDGVAYGQLSSISIGTDGTVTAKYDNGQSVAIYKVAVATFADVDGLASKSGSVYEATNASGDPTLHVAGEGGSGTIEGSALEGSTTDTAAEFSKMIVAQQAYSAASEVIKVDKDMFQTLISAMS
jgi:flagellar hook protein FlgE